MRKKSILISIILIIVSLDQITKAYVTERFCYGESFPVLYNIFHITYVTNTGTAFSMFSGYSGLLLIFSICAALGIAVYLFFDKFKKTSGEAIPLSFILGGAVGNLTDRIFRGAVVDFLDLRVLPIFNIADSFITIGMTIIIVEIIIRESNLKKIKK